MKFKHERLNKNSLIIAICLSYLDFFCFLNNKWISITLRNVDWFNFKYDRLNKNSLIIALFLSYIDFLLLLKQWMNINYNKNVDHFNFNHERLNKDRNVDHFNFKHERLNNNCLIMTLCLSYLDFLLYFKQWMNINYNKKWRPL